LIYVEDDLLLLLVVETFQTT